MAAQNMQFRNFSFANNPQTITIQQGNKLISHSLPGGGSIVQQLGAIPRIITCKGAFLGRSFTEAAAQLQNFRTVAAGHQTGLLFIPGLEPVPAYLRELVCEASSDGRILPYTMVFVEGESA